MEASGGKIGILGLRRPYASTGCVNFQPLRLPPLPVPFDEGDEALTHLPRVGGLLPDVYVGPHRAAPGYPANAEELLQVLSAN